MQEYTREQIHTARALVGHGGVMTASLRGNMPLLQLHATILTYATLIAEAARQGLETSDDVDEAAALWGDRNAAPVGEDDKPVDDDHELDDDDDDDAPYMFGGKRWHAVDPDDYATTKDWVEEDDSYTWYVNGDTLLLVQQDGERMYAFQSIAHDRVFGCDEGIDAAWKRYQNECDEVQS